MIYLAIACFALIAFGGIVAAIYIGLCLRWWIMGWRMVKGDRE